MAALGGSGMGNRGYISSGGCGSKSVPVAEGIITEDIYTSVSFLNYGLAFSSWVLWLEHLCDLGKVTV